MELQSGMWVLLLNDMRAPHYEHVEPVACAETKEELEQFVKDETVELYKTDNEGRVPETPPSVSAKLDLSTGEMSMGDISLGSTHGSNAKWCKTFRHGGPLEWFNKPSDDNYVQYFPPDPPPPPEIPHIRELRPTGLDDAFNSWNSNQQAEQAVNHNLGLALLDDTELVHCKTCGRITVPTREMRDGVTYLVCKCGEEMEEEPEDE